MRLDMDCVRDVLLCVEENTGLHQSCYFLDLKYTEAMDFLGDITEVPVYQQNLQEIYNNETLFYHVRYCMEAGLISTIPETAAYLLAVADLTPSGHDLLNKIRDTDRWRGIKKALPAIRNYSLDAISSLSQGMTSGAISAYLEKGH